MLENLKKFLLFILKCIGFVFKAIGFLYRSLVRLSIVVGVLLFIGSGLLVVTGWYDLSMGQLLFNQLFGAVLLVGGLYLLNDIERAELNRYRSLEDNSYGEY